MLTVKDLMTTGPETVTPDTTLREVLRLMNVDGCRHLPVLEGEKLVGIVTDRDVRLAVNSPVLHEDAAMTREEVLDDLDAGSCMTRDPMTVGPDTTAAEAAELLALYKFGAVPVVIDGELVGILSTVDYLNYVAESSRR